ncbi:MAG TPA: sugar transferase [Anaeromyxobacteraceae bacterium]|nr:sugar transferase [Anaeromyxobacteraceae bacterium]
MLREQAKLVDTALRASDLTVLVGAFPLAYVIRDGLRSEWTGALYPITQYWPVLAVALLFWLGASSMCFVYQPYRTRPIRLELARLARAMLLVAVGITALGFLLRQRDLSRSFVVLYCACAWILLALNRLALRSIARAARRRGYNTRRFAVVGSGPIAAEVVERTVQHREWGIHFAGYVLDDHGDLAEPTAPVLGRLSELPRILATEVVDEVLFAVPHQRFDKIEQALSTCEEQGIEAKIVINLFEGHRAQVSVQNINGLPVLAFTRTPSDAVALLAKRLFDVAVSATALIVLSPLFALVATAIRFHSPGPVFFRQRRVGMNGREFTLYKFRSMVVDAEEQLAGLRAYNEVGGPIFKMTNDPRVTRIGRFLRRTSIDELPQFWNVLRGEMSIVGPRPPLPEEVSNYQGWHRRRLSMKPGITCIWQVSGRSDVGDFDRWAKLDLQYIDSWSLWCDLKIFAKTIPAVLIGRGAR